MTIKKLLQQLGFWFYPFMLTMAFRAYAFENYGILFLHMTMMTLIGVLFEYLDFQNKRKIEALKFACELLGSAYFEEKEHAENSSKPAES